MPQLELLQPTPAIDGEIDRVRRSLAEKGYATTNDAALGHPADLAAHLDKTFFEPTLLGPELKEYVVTDRVRVRDVVEYYRQPDSFRLLEYPDISMPGRYGVNHRRNYNRTYALRDQYLAQWLSTVLALIPEAELPAHGTVGLDFLRTFTNVVPGPHQDLEYWVCIYLTAREAAGATTSIHPVDNPDETACAVTLTPGDYFIFRDRDFLHTVTPIEPRFEGDIPHRDALIVQFHHPESYLERPAES